MRGNKSDTAQVKWVMVAETQGQYIYQAVCSSICHTMYTVTEWGRKLGWAVSVWLFCDVLRPECQNYDGSILAFGAQNILAFGAQNEKNCTLRKIRFVALLNF